MSSRESIINVSGMQTVGYQQAVYVEYDGEQYLRAQSGMCVNTMFRRSINDVCGT